MQDNRQNRAGGPGRSDHGIVERTLGPLGLMALAGAPLIGALLAMRSGGSIIIAEIGAIFGVIIGLFTAMTIMGTAWLWEKYGHQSAHRW